MNHMFHVNTDPRIQRIENLLFEIEMEGEEATEERRRTLSRREEILDHYALKHFGAILIPE